MHFVSGSALRAARSLSLFFPGSVFLSPSFTVQIQFVTRAWRCHFSVTIVSAARSLIVMRQNMLDGKRYVATPS